MMIVQIESMWVRLNTLANTQEALRSGDLCRSEAFWRSVDILKLLRGLGRL